MKSCRLNEVKVEIEKHIAANIDFLVSVLLADFTAFSF